MSLADYLAKNYLTADPAGDKLSKKRKRKDKSGISGLQIADDGAEWAQSSRQDGLNDDDPTVVNDGRATQASSARWKTFGAKAPSSSDQAAADAIIASAEADARARGADADDAPQLVESAATGDDPPRMESGAAAGLQTAAQIRADVERKRADDRARFAAATAGAGADAKAQETIYRDASGRIVNVAMKRAEARRKAEDEEKQKAEDKEMQKGDLQRAAKVKAKQDLDDAKYLSVARYADDEELNSELKERQRWNDPAARFLTTKKTSKSVSGKPLYHGAAPPNRYGIRPGHRWDGVDRSNGFEREYFAAQNRRQNVRDLQYAWEMDE